MNMFDKMNSAEALNNFNKANNIKENIQECGTELINITENIPIIWKGKSSEAYVLLCQELLSDINKLSDSLNTLCEHFNKIMYK